MRREANEVNKRAAAHDAIDAIDAATQERKRGGGAEAGRYPRTTDIDRSYYESCTR